MEVGVLSGIARTQNADTDEGAEAEMSFHLRQKKFGHQPETNILTREDVYQSKVLSDN